MSVTSDRTNRENLSSVDDLAAQVRGPVFEPGDPGFEDEVASFAVLIKHRPAVAVGATCAEDVAVAVRFAAANGMQVVVQSTGHGAVVPADGGVLINTKRMQGMHVHADEQTACVEAGVVWRRVIEAAAEHGLAPLNGSSSRVGVVGYTVGGGLGLLGRKYGFAADHVRTMQLVTADGEIREVDAESEPDLFWAVRGGKGNFGIVTSAVIGLVPVSRLYGGAIFYPGAAAAEVLHAYRTWVSTLGDDTSTSIALLRLPPMPFVPEPLRGQFVVSLRVAYLGSAEDGERLVAPMRAAAPIIMDSVAEMPYSAIDSIHQEPADPMPTLGASALLREFSAETVDSLLSVVGPSVDTPLLLVELRHLQGALGRQPEEPNAVAGRDAAFLIMGIGLMLPHTAERLPGAVHGLMGAMGPHSAAGAMLNFMDATDPVSVAGAWSPADFQRLCAIKRRWDPAGMFHGGHVIPTEPVNVPSARGAASS